MTIAPPRQAPARRGGPGQILLLLASYLLILGTGGGAGLWLLRQRHAAVLIAVPSLSLGFVLCLAAAAVAARGHKRNPWPVLDVIAAAVAAAAWAVLPGLRPVLAAAAVAAVTGCFRAGIRSRRRRRCWARWEEVAAPCLPAGSPRPVTRILRWDGCDVSKAVITGPPGFDIAHPDFLGKLRRAITERTPARHVSMSADPLRDEVTVTVTEPQPETPADTRARAEERARIAAGHALPDVKIVKVEIDEELAGAQDSGAGQPLKAFAVQYGQTAKVTADANREQIARHLSMQLYGHPDMLRYRWEVDKDYVYFWLRRQFPEIIPHVAQDMALLYGGRTVLPYGDDEDGNIAVYPLSGTLPHALIIGATGGGKTQLLLLLAIEAARQGIEVRGCDPKRIELMGLRGWPNVTKIATRVTDMIKLIEDVYDEMHERYEAIETGQARESDFRRLLLILDEYFVFCMLVANWWAADREKNDPKEHPVIRKIGELAALARSGKINLVIGCQRPDATFFYEGARDNFGWRASLGRLSQQGAQMLWGDAKTGTDVPADIPGLCTATTSAGPSRVKVHWVPNPAKALTGELTEDDMQLLRSLLPPGTTWDGPLAATAPDPGFEDTAGADEAADADPVTGLLYLIRTALRTRTAHLTAFLDGSAPAAGPDAALYGWGADSVGGRGEPSGTWIGCLDANSNGRRIYLRPAEALQTARAFAAELGIRYDYDRDVLDKALHASGLLESENPEGGEKRYTIRKHLPGSSLDRDRVLGDTAPRAAPPAAAPPAAAPPSMSVPRAAEASELPEGARILVQDRDGQPAAVTVWSVEPADEPADHVVINYNAADGDPGATVMPATAQVPLADE
jgi:hypothetical protein